MTETPDERRERIDQARRDQAELNRQIGHELSGLAIKPSAQKAWQEFQDAQDEARNLGKRGARCEGQADRYQDYDFNNVPSPGRAKIMCGTCPFSTLHGDGTCGRFAEAERPGWGVWDGQVYGRKLADTERREWMKEQLAKQREGQS